MRHFYDTDCKFNVRKRFSIEFQGQYLKKKTGTAKEPSRGAYREQLGTSLDWLIFPILCFKHLKEVSMQEVLCSIQMINKWKYLVENIEGKLFVCRIHRYNISCFFLWNICI